MTAREPWCDSLEAPTLLHAFDYGEWSYYLSGHDEAALLEVDEPSALEWERLWMRPVKASDLDESERPDDQETVTRDERGRFVPVIDWIECHEDAAGARPFLGVKHRPIPRAAGSQSVPRP